MGEKIRVEIIYTGKIKSFVSKIYGFNDDSFLVWNMCEKCFEWISFDCCEPI